MLQLSLRPPHLIPRPAILGRSRGDMVTLTDGLPREARMNSASLSAPHPATGATPHWEYVICFSRIRLASNACYSGKDRVCRSVLHWKEHRGLRDISSGSPVRPNSGRRLSGRTRRGQSGRHSPCAIEMQLARGNDPTIILRDRCRDGGLEPSRRTRDPLSGVLVLPHVRLLRRPGHCSRRRPGSRGRGRPPPS